MGSKDFKRRWVVLAARQGQNSSHLADAETGQVLCNARLKRRSSDVVLDSKSLQNVCQNCIRKLAWLQAAHGVTSTPKISKEAQARLRAQRVNAERRERRRLGSVLPHPAMFRPEAQDP